MSPPKATEANEGRVRLAGALSRRYGYFEWSKWKNTGEHYDSNQSCSLLSSTKIFVLPVNNTHGLALYWEIDNHVGGIVRRVSNMMRRWQTSTSQAGMLRSTRRTPHWEGPSLKGRTTWHNGGVIIMGREAAGRDVSRRIHGMRPLMQAAGVTSLA